MLSFPDPSSVYTDSSARESRSSPSPSVPARTAVDCPEAREQHLARREADLQARRRAAAREIRRAARESAQLDHRFAGLETMLAKLTEVVVELADQKPTVPAPAAGPAVPHLGAGSSTEEALHAEIRSLRDGIQSLTMQNEQLAGEIAQGAVRRSIGPSDAGATMTWEQRKAMMFAQDSEGLPSEDQDARDSATQQAALSRLRSELQTRDRELAQLRELLEQRPMHCDEGTAVGAAAIAQLMDGDELILEERQRLQSLQTEWETKFRQMEIAASIERASLARERQQLERQNAELEEQLAHLKRELRQEEIAGPNQSRRWLAKLGLAE